MKSVSAPIKTLLQQGTAVRASARLIAEWNQNRYATTVTASNTIADVDPDIYPIESIVKTDRPKRGILKARTSHPDTGYESYTYQNYSDSPTTARYYVASPDAKYKYWESPQRSAGGTYSSTPAAIANCTPTVMYSEGRWVNKIVVGFENSYSGPMAYTIQVTYDGTTWNTIATTPSVDADGRAIIYRQANDSWGATQYLTNPVKVRGIRVDVTQINKSNSFLHIIEVSGRLESDLTDYVADFNSAFQMSERSFVLPLGKPSPQEGSITLSNIDARFSNDNTSSLYYGLLDAGAVFKLDLGLTTDSYSTITPTYEWIRMFTLKTDVWSGQDREITEVRLRDDAIILQTIKPTPILYTNVTVGEIFWRLLDSIGYSNYNYDSSLSDPSSLVPYFWVDGEQTVWEVFTELAESSQTAIYFDEYGILQIKPRASALKANQTPVWQFDALTNGSKLADIVSLGKNIEYEANTVNVLYKNTKVSEEGNGLPALESVWEPDDTFVIRASSLTETLTSSATTMKITATEAATWPYEGMVQIEGELIKYFSKQYYYYDAGGVLQNKYIKSTEEKNALDKLNSMSFKNYFSGRFDITGGRAQASTLAMDHYVDMSLYTNRYRTGGGTVTYWSGGLTHDTENGLVRLTTNSTFASNAWYTMFRSVTYEDQVMKWYGTRLKFPSGKSFTYGSAGLIIAHTNMDSGYYVEIVDGRTMTDSRRLSNNEVHFYVRKEDGSTVQYGGKGWEMAVAEDNWYDIDVTVSSNATDTRFRIFINGQLMNTDEIVVPAAGRPRGAAVQDRGEFGLFVRGDTMAEFEYIYASRRPAETPSDEGGFLDLIRGGYQSSQFDRELVYDRELRRVNGETVYAAYNQQYIDDFGPVVHEVRLMDVKFTKTPVLHSRLYFSNESQVFCPEYIADPFGAKFILVNASRENAVLRGEDTLTFGAENAVDQQMMIYGRVLIQDDEQKVTSIDEPAVRRRGEISVDIENKWIQTPEAAKALGDWVNLHWADSCDEITIESFGNPLLQLGDVVSVNYPALFYAANTHKYYVVEIKQNWENGLETSVTLRRARI